MKSVADLNVDLARFAKMRAAERAAVVDEKAAIKDVYCLKRDSPAFAKLFDQCEVECCTARQMVGALAIEKAGTVPQASREITFRRQVGLKVGIKGVPLVVIEKESATLWRFKIGESAGDCSLAFGPLMRIDE